MLLDSEEGLGFESERSKQVVSVLAIDDMEFLDSKALFQNPKSMSSSVVLLQLDVGLVFGGLICKDKSGCAGNSSIFNKLVFLCVCVCSALASSSLYPLLPSLFPFVVQLIYNIIYSMGNLRDWEGLAPSGCEIRVIN